MTPQELKNSILQLAIQGKLVEQRPEEGMAEELYKHIQAEKHALVKAGKIKKEKLLPEITEDEIPFEIPESWMWCYVGELFQHNTGKALNGSDKSGTPMTYITTSNLYWDRFELEKLKEMPFTESEVEKCTVQKGDLLVCEGGDYGRSAIWPYDYPMRIQNHIHRLRAYGSVSVRYFYYCFYLYKNAGMIAGKGIAIQGLSANALHALKMPLPPLAEQERIVAKIEKLLPLIDRYEQAWSRLEDFNKRFPGEMQKSILQMAIQGKLVEQRPEEGTGEELYRQILAEKQALIKAGKIKKEKPLPEITEDEIPFEIPENWKWVRLASICKSIADGDHQPPPQVTNGVPFLVISNVSGGKLDFSNTRFVPNEYFSQLSPERIAGQGDILFTVTGSYGIPVKVDTDTPFCFQRHMALLKLLLDWDYLYFALKSPVVKTQCDNTATGTAQKTVGLSSLRSIILPLPPLAEQKRIVARLEELLHLCERLK